MNKYTDLSNRISRVYIKTDSGPQESISIALTLLKCIAEALVYIAENTHYIGIDSNE